MHLVEEKAKFGFYDETTSTFYYFENELEFRQMVEMVQ